MHLDSILRPRCRVICEYLVRELSMSGTQTYCKIQALGDPYRCCDKGIRNGDPANSSGPELWTVASHSGRLTCNGLVLCNPSRIGLK